MILNPQQGDPDSIDTLPSDLAHSPGESADDDVIFDRSLEQTNILPGILEVIEETEDDLIQSEDAAAELAEPNQIETQIQLGNLDLRPFEYEPVLGTDMTSTEDKADDINSRCDPHLSQISESAGSDHSETLHIVPSNKMTGEQGPAEKIQVVSEPAAQDLNTVLLSGVIECPTDGVQIQNNSDFSTNAESLTPQFGEQTTTGRNVVLGTSTSEMKVVGSLTEKEDTAKTSYSAEKAPSDKTEAREPSKSPESADHIVSTSILLPSVLPTSIETETPKPLIENPKNKADELLPTEVNSNEAIECSDTVEGSSTQCVIESAESEKSIETASEPTSDGRGSNDEHTAQPSSLASDSPSAFVAYKPQPKSKTTDISLARRQSSVDEGKEKKSVMTKILEFVGVVKKKEAEPTSIFYDDSTGLEESGNVDLQSEDNSSTLIPLRDDVGEVAEKRSSSPRLTITPVPDAVIASTEEEADSTKLLVDNVILETPPVVEKKTSIDPIIPIPSTLNPTDNIPFELSTPAEEGVTLCHKTSPVHATEEDENESLIFEEDDNVTTITTKLVISPPLDAHSKASSIEVITEMSPQTACDDSNKMEDPRRVCFSETLERTIQFDVPPDSSSSENLTSPQEPMLENLEESVTDRLEEQNDGIDRQQILTELDSIIAKAKLIAEDQLDVGPEPVYSNLSKNEPQSNPPPVAISNEFEELRITTDAERKKIKPVTSKLSGQILKAIPPPRRKPFSETKRDDNEDFEAEETQSEAASNESQNNESKPSPPPVPPRRNRSKARAEPQPPPKRKGKK